ncbi:MAG: hypothetical protein QOJ03_961 [Frankiaceae bacterium]|jgi:nitroreductase|nr:hypothetical protein [Frankiaceae bacterium]
MSLETQALLRPAEVRAIVAAASRAPSVHNTQPWKIAWDGIVFTVAADTSRALAVTDPDHRELAMSCGAALYGLRLALRKFGFDSTVELMPTDDPGLLARVGPKPGIPADAEERLMFAAISRRHTHRGPFDDRPVSAELAVRLQQAAAEEHALLFYLTDPGQRTRLLHLARAAERELRQDPRVREETEAWTPEPNAGRRDGIPSTAYAGPQSTNNIDELQARDLDLGRGIGQLHEPSRRPGTLAVLATERDDAKAWLVAGQALQRLLLTAARHGAFAAIHSQAVELPHVRAEIRRELSTAAVAQLVLRLGYAAEATTTPRRAVDAILTDLTD